MSKGIGNSRIEVYERVGISMISALKRRALWRLISSPSLRNCEELFDECLVPVRRFPGRLGQCFSVTYSRRTRGLESRDPTRIDRAE